MKKLFILALLVAAISATAQNLKTLPLIDGEFAVFAVDTANMWYLNTGRDYVLLGVFVGTKETLVSDTKKSEPVFTLGGKQRIVRRRTDGSVYVIVL